MSKVAKRLYATDETFREVADLLFGDGADELISKLSPEQKKKKFERRQAQVGLASNVLGLAAGGAGTLTAYKELDAASREKKGLPPKTPKMGRLNAIKGKHAVGLAAAGLTLQAANVGGDVVANRVLARSAKDDEKKVTKALTSGARGLKHGRLVPVVASSVGGSSLLTYEAGKRKGRKEAQVSKSEPTSSDISLSTGKLKRLAAKRLADSPPAQQVRVEVGRKAREKMSKSIGEVTWEGEFSKVDADKRQVFGWASIVELNGEPVVDLQGDYIDIDEIEKSAYDYVIKSRKGGDMHRRNGEEPVHASDMIESFIVTPEKIEKMGLPKSTPIGWWVGYQVNDDEAWNLVKNGKRTGFSIHGRGQRTPTEI